MQHPYGPNPYYTGHDDNNNSNNNDNTSSEDENAIGVEDNGGDTVFLSSAVNMRSPVDDESDDMSSVPSLLEENVMQMQCDKPQTTPSESQSEATATTTTATTTTKAQLPETPTAQTPITLPTATSTTTSTTEPMEVPERPTTRRRYGGLRNLGNTCYMNSALQMLASADHFLERLRKTDPVETDTEKLKLRNEFLDLMDALRDEAKSNSNTASDNDDNEDYLAPIDPHDFKRVIDERSSLFVGYLQQDSHEFLTTLLDLLNEDYEQPKPDEEAQDTDGDENKPEEVDTEELVEDTNDDDDDNDNNHGDADGDVEMGTSSTQPSSDDTGDTIDEDANDGQDEDDQERPQPMDATPTSPVRVPSFSQLEVDGISRLLHGENVGNDSNNNHHATKSVVFGDDNNNNDNNGSNCGCDHDGNVTQSGDASATATTTTTATQPMVCKLVGGRSLPPKPSVRSGSPFMVLTEPITTTTTGTNDHSGSDCNDDVIHMATATPATTATTNAAATIAATTTVSEDDQQQQTALSEPALVSPIDDAFLTEIRTRLTCDSCKYSRSHVEKYYHLSLDIGNGQSDDDNCSVEEGLRRFFQPEKLSIKCDKCFGESATQTKHMVRLPRTLLLHLKRFIVDVSPDWTSISYRKNRSPVDFEDNISLGDGANGLADYFASDVRVPAAMDETVSETDMTEGNMDSPMEEDNSDNDDSDNVHSDDDVDENDRTARSYVLRSVVNHIGSTASCGHYTADGKRLYDNTTTTNSDKHSDDTKGNDVVSRKWTRFNDSSVSRIEPDEAVNQSTRRTAYMIMYELE